jgi:pilus assembly protein CpaF
VTPTPWRSDRVARATPSPLVEIERLVQERAKDVSLEMSSAVGEAKLRALIGEEVARWGDEHRRGGRPFALADPDGVAERAFRNLARYGPLTPLLDDDDVWEIMVASDQRVDRGPGVEAEARLTRGFPVNTR